MNATTFHSGLIVDAVTLAAPRLKVPAKWDVPNRIDFRDYVLPPSDQADKPYCAAYTMAGYLEVMNWRKHDAYAQIDPEPIYKEAKRLDGDDNPGTTFFSVVQAAKNLKLLKKGYQMRRLATLDDVRYAMHRYGICMVGLSVTEAWMSPNSESGRIPELPDINLGGHAVLLNFMDKRAASLGFQNSWGLWGCRGYGEISESTFQRKFMTAMVVEREDD